MGLRVAVWGGRGVGWLQSGLQVLDSEDETQHVQPFTDGSWPSQ